MGFQTAGSNVTQRIVFNSGTIDFGSNRLVEVDNVSISVEWSTSPLYVLGSIKAQDLVRHSEKVSLTAKLKSFNAEMEQIAYGASSSGSPMGIDTLDGQPTLQNPVVTLYDRNSKEIQYQLLGAIVKSSKGSFKMEDYGEFDIEIDAKDITCLYTS